MVYVLLVISMRSFPKRLLRFMRLSTFPLDLVEPFENLFVIGMEGIGVAIGREEEDEM